MKRERDGIIFKMQEIERKYLVKDISKLKLESYEKKTIIQVYVYHDKITTIRKRMIEKTEMLSMCILPRLENR